MSSRAAIFLFVATSSSKTRLVREMSCDTAGLIGFLFLRLESLASSCRGNKSAVFPPFERQRLRTRRIQPAVEGTPLTRGAESRRDRVSAREEPDGTRRPTRPARLTARPRSLPNREFSFPPSGELRIKLPREQICRVFRLFSVSTCAPGG